MSEIDEKVIVVTVDDAAWQGFYDVLDSVNTQLADWGEKHNMPPSMVLGAAMAVTAVVAHFADVCDCEECMLVPISFADEVIDRVEAVERTIGQAVH